MKKLFRDFTNLLAAYAEIFLALFLTLVIIVLALKMAGSSVIHIGDAAYDLEYYLQHAMTLAIGLEFVKMLCMHTPGTVIEVLLFAIARQMVVEHLGITQMLLGTIAIAVLFAIRKYLFSSMDEIDHVIIRGSQTVGYANFIAKTKIPEEKTKLLRDVIRDKLIDDNKTIAIGACIHYKDCALRIDHMKDDVITRVEVIRTI